jgi:transcriptional regulator with XRE-family HTH domain
MSANGYSSPRPASIRRRVWSEMFGQFIRSAREKKGRSIEEAARLAGMTVAEWEAVEAGEVPGTHEQFGALASGLGMSREELVPLLLFCRGAWIRPPRRSSGSGAPYS